MTLDSIGRAVVVGQANGNWAVARVLGDIAPTAANATISGSVRAGKAGVIGATVTLTDMRGTIHTTRTNSFGSYQFTDVPLGTNIISVSAKRYRFENPTRVINVQDNISDFDFVAIE
jgi:hypothetical protein